MMSPTSQLASLPLLPLRSTVLFPTLLMPFAVARSSSVAAVESALATEEKEVFVVAQRDNTKENPGQEDLYAVGTRAVVKKMTRSPDGGMELLVLGTERAAMVRLESAEPYLRATVSSLPMPVSEDMETEALKRAITELATRAMSMAQPQAQVDLNRIFLGAEDTLRLVYLLTTMMSLDLPKEQAVLEAATRTDALRLLHGYLTHEINVLELRTQINNQARTEMSREQREYVLRQQLRAIQQELGERNPEQAEVDSLRERLESKTLPEPVRKEVERELSRLERIPAASPEHQIVRGYLELVLDLPWGVYSDDSLDIANARRILDEDHFDLRDVKDRILEHLAVLKLNPSADAPILCFVGPPGVGKTSLGQSIARSMGRRFERISLGGMHDEAELRGHRRTYIGAMPGRLIQAVRRAGVSNPVVMLDEVDKLGRDFRGDPAAALLEILDPAQNDSFRDNFLDLPYDLSKVLFIATANTLNAIPQPLLDRMELLRLAGYTAEEKVEIARRYQIPRQIREAGLQADQLDLPDETVRYIVARYTREAGVRQLERQIARVARKSALRFAEGGGGPVRVTPTDLAAMLGPETFSEEQLRRDLPPGVATGMAWTETGGEILYLEATLLPGGKGLTITGQLGEVMQESVRAAQSYLWAHAADLGIDPARFRDDGVHLHVPAGAIPKDGPSAGVTATVALASLYTGHAARGDTAMTGEVTLAGLVLPIGGVKEKVLAARRAGIRRVVLPKANEKDLPELPEQVRAETEVVLAERIEDVLSATIPALAERLAVLSLH
ncbi:MAG: endopeptidase La [Bryobacteraceae bacterium]|nr:endopeptidase La [Bryobacteraceae bacterium]